MPEEGSRQWNGAAGPQENENGEEQSVETEWKIEEGEAAGQGVTSGDMLQINSFGRKKERCQATGTERRLPGQPR